ncbi:hypothetical protein Tco_0594349, partial [Tanacetum coccineum]
MMKKKAMQLSRSDFESRSRSEIRDFDYL